MDPKRLLAEALQLPVEERAALAGELIQSLDSRCGTKRPSNTAMNLTVAFGARRLLPSR
jgi:hypothetical protein